MEILEIDPKQILMDKPNGEERSFSKEFCANLARDIQLHGLLQPPAVRALADKQGFYKVIFGAHRIYACAKILNWKAIPCRVFEADEEFSEFMRRAENLWRNPLTKDQHLKAIKLWFEEYSAKFPEAVGSGSKTKTRKQDKPGDESEAKPVEASKDQPESKDESGDVEDSKEASKEGNDSPASFPEVLATATGTSVSKAKNETRIAKSFTAEQLEALGKLLEAKKLHYNDLLLMAKNLKTDKQKENAVKLVCSGMPVKQAIAKAMEPEGDNKTPTPVSDDALADDEWLDVHCRAVLDGLKSHPLSRVIYTKNAIFYRSISKHLAAFKKSTRSLRVENAKTMGPLLTRVHALCGLRHPKDWLICGACGGSGKDNNSGQRCEPCYGNGFKLTFDPVPNA